MRQYKFYFIGKTGHINGPAQAFDLPNDAAAITKAKLLVNGHDVEVWQGRRVVGYVVPEGTLPHDEGDSEGARQS